MIRAVLLLGILPAAAAQEPGSASIRHEKIDPRIDFGGDEHPAVLVLGSRQFLEPPHGFAAFQERHASAARRALRGQVIDALRAIAAEEQAEWLERLDPRPEAASVLHRFWLVNAIALRLERKQVDALAELESVRAVLPAGFLPRFPDDAGSMAELPEAGPRPPFEVGTRRVPWNLERIGAARVWKEAGLSGEGVVVAMLDSGVNYLHEDLVRNVWRNEAEIPGNRVDDDGNGYRDDAIGFDFVRGRCDVRARGTRQHGTWTAGIVAGDGSGGVLTGVAPRARVMPLVGFQTVPVILAHQYALEHGADVLNMSFSVAGLGQTRGTWRLMSEHAVCAGLVLVSGAGNFRRSQPLPVQQRVPEGIPCVISAGGVRRDDAIAPYSSLGPVEWGSVALYGDHPMPDGLIKPDIVAYPGPHYPILGTSADAGYLDPNERVQGNSFSGPHVSGAVALLLEADPELPAWEVRGILERTAVDLGPEGKDNRFGAGRLDVWAAVGAVRAR